MILHSPALLFTADVEDGRLEIGFIVSWGLFIPLLLISQRVRFLDPLKEKILKIYFSVPQCFPRNDRILMVLSAYQSKILKEGCEKGVLMQYKCMEKEIRKLHGRILFPICHVYRDHSGRNAALTERNQESLYTGSRFSPPAPLAPGKRNGFCRFVKNMITHRKSTDTIPCSMSPHSRTTRAGLTQDFPVI